jgi:hypothetical protein
MTSLLVRKLPAGRGLAWLGEGMMLFRRGPLGIVAAFSLFLLVAVALMTLPYVGGPAVQLITPAITAGLLAGCHALASGGIFHLGYLGAGFRQQAVPLITVGGIYLVCNIVINQAMHVMAGGAVEAMLAEMMKHDPDLEALRALAPQSMPAVFLGLALLTPLMLAAWFAPALILFDGMPAPLSMLVSLRACVRNIAAFTLYGLASALILALGLLIPLGIGLLVAGPWLTASTYAAYRDIFRPVEQDDADGKPKPEEKSTS